MRPVLITTCHQGCCASLALLPEGLLAIVASKYANSGFDELAAKALGNKDRQIEVIGKLREMPRPVALESWKAYCGLDRLPPAPSGGRWVLEMHEP